MCSLEEERRPPLCMRISTWCFAFFAGMLCVIGLVTAGPVLQEGGQRPMTPMTEADDADHTATTSDGTRHTRSATGGYEDLALLSLHVPPPCRHRVALLSCPHQPGERYVAFKPPEEPTMGAVMADRDARGTTETACLVPQENQDGQLTHGEVVAIRSSSGMYVAVTASGTVEAISDAVGPSERFKVINECMAAKEGMADGLAASGLASGLGRKCVIRKNGGRISDGDVIALKSTASGHYLTAEGCNWRVNASGPAIGVEERFMVRFV